MALHLSWLTTIPASTSQEYAPGAPDGAEDLRLVTATISSRGREHYRRTPLGDAVAELLARAEARLRGLRAPAEGLDPEEVLRRGQMLEAIISIPSADRTTGQRADREALYAHQAAAAPALAHALIREIDARRQSDLDARAAMKEAEELRLTLAAEQGKPEGAPKGWTWDPDHRWWWRAVDGGLVRVFALGGRADLYGWAADYPGQRTALHRPTARAAMLAADAAVKP